MSVAGALLIALFAHHCEKFLVKYIPGILKSVFVGMLTIAITFTFGITILGPFGDMVGACIGVGLRAKNKTLKGECFSLAFGCIVAGVTEPAIYGVNFRLKKPMFGVMAVAVAIVVAAIVTFFLGFDESLIVEPEEAPEAKAAPAPAATQADAQPVNQSKITELKAYATGESIVLADVNDGVFSAKMLGDGLATIPDGSEVRAPVDSKVCSIAATKHAIGLQLDNGVQLLIHIGVDTVNMNGKGFRCREHE